MGGDVDEGTPEGEVNDGDQGVEEPVWAVAASPGVLTRIDPEPRRRAGARFCPAVASPLAASAVEGPSDAANCM
jgi:hypothetical protein